MNRKRVETARQHASFAADRTGFFFKNPNRPTPSDGQRLLNGIAELKSGKNLLGSDTEGYLVEGCYARILHPSKSRVACKSHHRRVVMVRLFPTNQGSHFHGLVTFVSRSSVVTPVFGSSVSIFRPSEGKGRLEWTVGVGVVALVGSPVGSITSMGQILLTPLLLGFFA